MIRFNFDCEKAIDAIEYIARLQPGITQYYVSKILFFADREHVLDYGRPITGDRYVAMEHGPVPSAVRNLLRLDGDYPDEIIDQLEARIVVEIEGNKQHVFARQDATPSKRLSGSDREYLRDAVEKYGKMSFTALRELSHKDPAYTEAWERVGTAANEMNVELWLNQLENAALAKSQLMENTRCAG